MSELVSEYEEVLPLVEKVLLYTVTDSLSKQGYVMYGCDILECRDYKSKFNENVKRQGMFGVVDVSSIGPLIGFLYHVWVCLQVLMNDLRFSAQSR